MDGTATTTTLADALLDDLDDLSDVGGGGSDNDDATTDDDDDDEHYDGKHNEELSDEEFMKSADRMKDDDEYEEDHKPKAKNCRNNNADGVEDCLYPRLLNDNALQKHLNAIRELSKTNNSTTTTTISTKDKQEEGQREIEHKLIVQSNKQLVALSNELIRAYEELCKVYSKKFPELEELIPNPIQYTKAVRVIGNEMDMTRITDELTSFLSSNQIITISVSGSTTSGRSLNQMELQKVDSIASYIEQIITIRTEIEAYVANQMEQLAPSVVALLGSSTLAAKLIGLAGGLHELAKIPACNIQVLGQTKQTATSRAGLSTGTSSNSSSTTITKPHQGILMECEMIQNCRPKILQMKVLKMIASKLALVARHDSINVSTGRLRTATAGQKFRHDIEQCIIKLQEPDKAQILKALPNAIEI